MTQKCGIIFSAQQSNSGFASTIPDIKLFFRFVKEIIYRLRE
jgi:hypothetical protein